AVGWAVRARGRAAVGAASHCRGRVVVGGAAAGCCALLWGAACGGGTGACPACGAICGLHAVAAGGAGQRERGGERDFAAALVLAGASGGHAGADRAAERPV